MKKILYMADAYKVDRYPLKFAGFVCNLLKSPLSGLFVEPAHDALPEKQLREEILNSGFALDPNLPIGELKQKFMDRNIAVFHNACEEAGINSHAEVINNDVLTRMLLECRYADLLLVDPALSMAVSSTAHTPYMMRNILSQSECPVMLMPDRFDGLEEIVFAYDGSPSAVFAIKQFSSLFTKFAIRELLYLEHYSIGYLVLQVTGKSAQCYRGHLNKLQEINDGIFSRVFRDDYEYSKPAKNSSFGGQEGLKGFERDKSVTEANRLKSFYRETDHLVGSYLGKQPMVVAGPKKDISLLLEVSRHQKNIIATINGNYAKGTVKALEERVWPVVKSWIDEKKYAGTLSLIEENGQHVTEGIKNIWAAAKEGRGYKLVVEKNYSCSAFLNEKTGKLHFKASKAAHHKAIDAVEEVLKLVLERGGEVLFVKNGALDKHAHICLITRY